MHAASVGFPASSRGHGLTAWERRHQPKEDPAIVWAPRHQGAAQVTMFRRGRVRTIPALLAACGFIVFSLGIESCAAGPGNRARAGRVSTMPDLETYTNEQFTHLDATTDGANNLHVVWLSIRDVRGEVDFSVWYRRGIQFGASWDPAIRLFDGKLVDAPHIAWLGGELRVVAGGYLENASSRDSGATWTTGVPLIARRWYDQEPIAQKLATVGSDSLLIIASLAHSPGVALISTPDTTDLKVRTLDRGGSGRTLKVASAPMSLMGQSDPSLVEVGETFLLFTTQNGERRQESAPGSEVITEVGGAAFYRAPSTGGDWGEAQLLPATDKIGRTWFRISEIHAQAVGTRTIVLFASTGSLHSAWVTSDWGPVNQVMGVSMIRIGLDPNSFDFSYDAEGGALAWVAPPDGITLDASLRVPMTRLCVSRLRDTPNGLVATAPTSVKQMGNYVTSLRMVAGQDRRILLWACANPSGDPSIHYTYLMSRRGP